MADDRERLGRLVRDTWDATVHELVDDPVPSRVAPWDELDSGQREACRRIGEAVAAATQGLCCDLHGRNCEPPSELCCENCTEARHCGWADSRGVRQFGHPAGESCSNPDLSGVRLVTDERDEARAECERLRSVLARVREHASAPWLLAVLGDEAYEDRP